MALYSKLSYGYTMPDDESYSAQPVQIPYDIPMPSNDNQQGKFDSATIIWQLTSTDILNEIEHDFKGEILDENGVWKAKGKVLVNEQGIRTILTIIRSRVNKIVFLSKLNEDIILKFCRDIELDLEDQILLNYQKWHLDKTNCSMLLHKVSQLIYCGLMRAEGEGERKFLGETRRVNEQIISNPYAVQIQKDKGLFGRIFS